MSAPLIGWLAHFDSAAVLGIYAGAVTNTPALGAPWQTLSTLVLDCAHTEARSVSRRNWSCEINGTATLVSSGPTP